MRTVPRTRWSSPRRLSRATAALAHLVLIFAVLFATVQSGRRYFYCEAFGLLPYDPCVQATSHADRGSVPGMLSEQPKDCCEIVTFAAMPDAAQAAGPSIAPAARVAVIPARWLTAPIAFAPSACVDREFERWRPPPRTSNDVRAQLMVFLT